MLFTQVNHNNFLPITDLPTKFYEIYTGKIYHGKTVKVCCLTKTYLFRASMMKRGKKLSLFPAGVDIM
jgi:hypothetical protein